MANILAIDDDIEILHIIKRALEKDGHMIDICNKVEAINKNKLSYYNLILLDVMMPNIDGFSFCGEVRKDIDCPIIFITAKTMESDVVEGLSLGADDYIKKPFSIAELRARVNAHIRREHRENHYRILDNEFRFDISEKILYIKDKQVKLTKSEYEICEFLVKNKGQVFSLEQILVNVFGYHCESDSSAIREHIKNIRAKFLSQEKKPIETVWGIGYKWV